MSYFPLTGKLLSEATFLTFVSRINEEYISLDPAQYELYQSKGKSFALSTKKWLEMCKKGMAIRHSTDCTADFCVFALNRLKALINFDVDLYVKEFRSGKTENRQAFRSEYEKIRTHLLTAPYMGPMVSVLVEALDSIPEDILSDKAPVEEVSAVDGRDFLTWSGPIAELFALFEQLRTTKSSISSKPLLAYSQSEIAAFIVKHFRDSNGDRLKEDQVRDLQSTPIT